MLRFRSCPRCKGDVLIDRDYHGWYEQCLQCGYQRDLEKVVEVQLLRYQESKKKVVRQKE